MNETKEKNLNLLNRFKLPVAALLLGVFLMLIPSGSGKEIAQESTDVLLGKVLSSAQGVGDSVVIISDKGVVVVCEGADKAKVRLEIIQAISSYTGYSSEKITILKMLD